jgi:hypothetical protein
MGEKQEPAARMPAAPPQVNVLDPALKGTLRRVLVPSSFGRDRTDGGEFTVLAVEIWTRGVLVNLQVYPDAGQEAGGPGILLEDHAGTVYTRRGSARLGSRHLQYFEPTAPEGIRSLTIKCADSAGIHQVLFVAVPPLRR